MSEAIARTMPGQIARRIRQKILSGSYAPGMQLLQDSIAADFGVSKIPVREALVQLKSEGLVDIFAHRGFQVRRTSTAEMAEVFNLRLAIEPAAAAKGARLAGPDERQSARAALQILDSALASGDLSQCGDLNSAFHLALVVPHRQPLTADSLYRLHTLSQRYVRLHLQSDYHIEWAVEEHRGLFEVWAAGRPRQTAERVRRHIEATRDDLASVLT